MAREANKQQQNASVQQQGKKKWSVDLLVAMKDPAAIVKSDNLVTVIKDAYPKAEFHYLILPKEVISDLAALKKEHLHLLKHIEDVANEVIKFQRHNNKTFNVGFPARSRMFQLHLHVISDDMNSCHLSTKWQWNSFTTGFFIKLKDVRESLQKYGKFSVLTSQQCHEFLNIPLKCHKCDFIPKNLVDLKKHISNHLVVMANQPNQYPIVPTSFQGASHLAMDLIAATNNREAVVKFDHLVTVIKDAYPKAEFHYLILPNQIISDLTALRREHLHLLMHMEEVAKEVISFREHTNKFFYFGYPAQSKMFQLHLHVISDDFNSRYLNTKWQWNSLTTAFFIKPQVVRESLERCGYFPLPSFQQRQEYLNLPLKCHKCNFFPASMQELKHHLLTHLGIINRVSDRVPQPGTYHWSMALLVAMNNPYAIIKTDSLITVIKDAYPKAKFHYLILPNEVIANLEALKPQHVHLLKHMEGVAKYLVTAFKEHSNRTFMFGYHAQATMFQLHLHVVSDDLNSYHLKTDRHWNSFTTKFLIKPEDVRESLEKCGQVSLPSFKQSKEYINTPLKCHKCDFSTKTMSDLKTHILIHLK